MEKESDEQERERVEWINMKMIRELGFWVVFRINEVTPRVKWIRFKAEWIRFDAWSRWAWFAQSARADCPFRLGGFRTISGSEFHRSESFAWDLQRYLVLYLKFMILNYPQNDDLLYSWINAEQNGASGTRWGFHLTNFDCYASDLPDSELGPSRVHLT